MGTRQYRLGRSEGTGVRDNNDVGFGIGGGSGCGIKQGLECRGVISGSNQVEWSRMEGGERLIHLDRRQAGNMAGGVQRSIKNPNINRDRV